jgi:carbon starvation protein
MNSVVLLLFALLWFFLFYWVFGKKYVQKRLASPLDEAATPAISKRDDIDYCPTHPLVLFGHHFSAIAGAGPIIGPIIAAAAFGWGPPFLWILIAGVFIGALHDYMALIISVRHGAVSIPDLAKEYVSNTARIFFLLFVELALILVLAVFASISADMLIETPEIVLPTFGVIPVAMLFGFSQYRMKGTLPLWARTAIAFALLISLVIAGFYFPIKLPFTAKTSYVIWFSCLVAYCFFASTLPVWVLLQPRDYISSWVLLAGMLLALAGIAVMHPDINFSILKNPFAAAVASASDIKLPFFVRWYDPENGHLFPFLFILIACGAISGFHSIISGGTTAKQLAKERHALPVAFGAMLVEALMATIAVIIVASAMEWGGETGLIATIKKSSALGAFGAGFGNLLSFCMNKKIGAIIGITMINIFVLTTLDAVTRLGRFLTTEIGGNTFPVLKSNRNIATLVPLLPAVILGITGSWKTIWPLFGAANQLVAALGFIVIIAYLLAKDKPIRAVIAPALLMLIATTVALVMLAYKFMIATPKNYIAGLIAIVLIILAAFMTIEGIKFLINRKSK